MNKGFKTRKSNAFTNMLNRHKNYVQSYMFATIQIVWDFYGYSEDFKDNVERLKYITDMKIRLCEEFEELKISLFGNLKWNFAFLICSEGDIATNEKIGINYICAPETTKQDYIEFEQKVREYFKFDFCDKQYQERNLLMGYNDK